MKPVTKTYWEKINFFFLLAVVSTIIFRHVCTLLIIGYIVFSICAFLVLKQKIKFLSLSLIISIPFFIEVLTFWNNDYFYYGIKSLAQKLVYLFFPFLIIQSPFNIKIFKLISYWNKITLAILSLYLIRYFILFHENVANYLRGIDVWDMGYSFSRSIANNHAPALNLIVSFVCVSALYVFLKELKENSKKKNLLNFLTYILLFAFVLIINTRIALVCTVAGSFFILVYGWKNFFTVKRTLGTGLLLVILISAFIYLFPYTIQKYTKVSFEGMDKVGRLDEIPDPEGKIYNSLATRLSIWKSAWELSQRNLWIGVGASDGKRKLNDYYGETNQMFLHKYKFPVHNQYLDFLVRFGIVGVVLLFIFMLTPLKIGFKLKNPLIIYYACFFIVSNLTDDFLIRFDGIAFSCLMVCLFSYHYLRHQGRYSSNP